MERAECLGSADRNVVTALFVATDAEAVRLLKAGAKIDARDNNGSTPLLSTTTDAAAVALIEAGADVGAQDRSGETIAKRATNRRYTATLRLLRDRAAKKYAEPAFVQTVAARCFRLGAHEGA